jgi:hypothetical protein
MNLLAQNLAYQIDQGASTVSHITIWVFPELYDHGKRYICLISPQKWTQNSGTIAPMGFPFFPDLFCHL